jgi:cytochrome c peroxidase
MKINGTILVILAALFFCVGFVTKEASLQSSKKVTFKIPKGWPAPSYDFSQNPLTEAGIALGKKLFYEVQLSKNNTISCGTCHQQFGAFNSYDHPLSHGLDNALTSRNAPSLFNLAWQKEFMWDGGINHLDLQPLAPITAHNEMGESIDNILAKLKKNKQYPKLFKAAFGDENINTQRLGKSLSQFLLTLVSSNSKYDRVMRSEDSFLLPEKLGYDIFKTKCVQCHTEPLFTNYSYTNIGMPLDPFLKDLGRMNITNNPNDSLKFKVPSLRNVVVSFPYGHDGRFFSLMSVFEHYRNKMQVMPNTDSLLKNKLPLSNYEIGQLKAFLHTLTDSVFLKDPQFAEQGSLQNRIAPLDQHN